MSNIKKGYTELYAVLLANSDKKVKSVMDLLIPIMESQQRTETHFTDENGRLQIYCYYHKQWEHVDQVPYGSKANTETGLNTMCKVGTNLWTTQYRKFKESAATILDMIASGELAHDKDAIDAKRAEFKEVRHQIVPLEVSH